MGCSLSKSSAVDSQLIAKAQERSSFATEPSLPSSAKRRRSLFSGESTDDALAEPEAHHPVNWNLKFSDLVVTDLIANGGYCSVLACSLHGEPLAVKLPLARCSDPEGAIVDLANEIEIFKRLRHPHLCGVYGAGGGGNTGDMPFLVLERLQYKNLAQQCGTDVDDMSVKAQLRQRKARSKVPLRDRLEYGLQLAKLLRYLHDESIPGGFVVHRDLKPANIGISRDGQLKVFDLGLARIKEKRDEFTDKYVMTGQTGSQRYMSPEVFDGMPYNEKADMFSYGIVLWELCTLQKPFAGMTSHQHARKVFQQNMRPPVERSWPLALRNLLAACWDGDPNRRINASGATEQLTAMLESWDERHHRSDGRL